MISDGVEFDVGQGTYFEVLKPPTYGIDGKHINVSSLPWHSRVNWLSTSILMFPIVASLSLLPSTPLQFNTLLLSLLQYFLTGLGVTAGYHRLFSHRSFRATPAVQCFLLIFGAAAFQGSARWWCRNHRAHHRYMDSDKDPYSVHKGFWHAHIGWMILKQDVSLIGRVDISDLNSNYAVMFQHEHYLQLALLFGVALPVFVAGFGWGDWKGGFVYACLCRVWILQQATFCVNSVAHTFGHKTFSKRHTSFDHIGTALLTFGEGYHNFHHEFPHDYRNGTLWFHYDPCKWIIRLLSIVSLTSSLVAFPDNELRKARLQVMQEDLDLLKKDVDWGVPAIQLPLMTWKQLNARIASNKERLIVVDGYVCKVDDFLPNHPGGPQLLNFWNGRDATEAFTGQVYKHSKAAHNLLAHLRIAKLSERLE